jgi:D-beta-D-heptose 7-phosphate kinase/D-beta-D-heptose 1-phosphate adenosyltransferase
MPKAVLVIGDSMLDRYIEGPVERISPEAPCPVVNVKNTVESPGGAANVAMGIAALGAPVYFVTLLSGWDDDEGTSNLKKWLADNGDIKVYPWYQTGFRLPIKTRVMNCAGKHLVRCDENGRFGGEYEAIHAVRTGIVRQFERCLSDNHDAIGCVVLSDYNYGVLTDDTSVSTIISLAKKAGKPVIVDPKSSNLLRYHGCTILTPNAREAASALQGGCRVPESCTHALGHQLCMGGYADVLLVTAGERGMFLTQTNDLKVRHIPAYPQPGLCDPTGAGDTVIACLAYEVCRTDDTIILDVMQDLARRASICAGIAVSKPGTATVSAEEYQEALEQQHLVPRNKIGSIPQAKHLVNKVELYGGKVVFTNGCFDALHPGHIYLLQEARRRGDVLIVGIDDDKSVAELKGPGRPIYPLMERARMVAALGCVDFVLPFATGNLEEVIRQIEPDVLVKGGSYHDRDPYTIPGARFVLECGGELFLPDMLECYSTSDLVSRVKALP